MTVGEFLKISNFEEVVVENEYWNFGTFTSKGLERFMNDCIIKSIGFHNDGKKILLLIADE